MAKRQLQKNEAFDINKFPAVEGMLVFGISMSRISNSQNAKKCFEYVEELTQKIAFPYVGLTLLYSDNLYLYQEGDPSKLNKKFQTSMISHKNEFQKVLDKNQWYIRDSFSFISWNQALLEARQFMTFFTELKKIYAKDKALQKYVKADIKSSGRNVNTNSIHFILEEILLFYLVMKGELKFPNKYLNGKEKWVLFCYPGKPLKSEIYLFQKNFFKLKNKLNEYEEAFYDLEEKKLYRYSNIDLDTFDS